MKVTKRSPRTGELNTMELPITLAELAAWQNGPGLIQNMLPQLSQEQREFLLTGYTPEDWDMLFPPEDKETP